MTAEKPISIYYLNINLYSHKAKIGTRLEASKMQLTILRAHLDKTFPTLDAYCLTVAQLAKKFPASYESQGSTDVFTRNRHWTLTYTSPLPHTPFFVKPTFNLLFLFRKNERGL
jgi:hypothetical protein